MGNQVRAGWPGVLSKADWLHGARARAYVRILGAACLVICVGWVALTREGRDANGKPLGVDFLCYWTASILALRGEAAAAYDLPSLHALQHARFPGVGALPFFYPPTYLLVCLPLALAPYLTALTAWLVATGAAYWAAVRRLLGDLPGRSVAVLAFPAVLVNAGHGQNGFLTTALFAGGVVWLKARPVLAGAMLGALIVKPHLGLLIPLVLAAGGRWRAFAAAGTTAAGLIGVSWAVFGTEAWVAYLGSIGQARQVVESGALDPAKLQSAFAALRIWAVPLPLAYAVQAAVTASAAGAVAWFAWRRRGSEALGPALAAATLLASPYLLDYDLLLLAVPLAWTFSQGRRGGFLPWEKLVLLAGFLLPLVSRALAMGLNLPLGPVVIAAVLWAVLRRGWREAPEPKV